MQDHALPPDLQQLARELARRPRPDPPAELRPRVIQKVRLELRPNGSRSRWAFAAAVAAAALVWLNLSLSAIVATDFNGRAAGPKPPVGQLTERIGRLLPELSDEEVLRQTILLRAASDLPTGALFPAIPPASCYPDELLLQGD